MAHSEPACTAEFVRTGHDGTGHEAQLNIIETGEVIHLKADTPARLAVAAIQCARAMNLTITSWGFPANVTWDEFDAYWNAATEYAATHGDDDCEAAMLAQPIAQAELEIEKAAAEDDLDKAVAIIQFALGQTDGGPAGQFFAAPRSGEDWSGQNPDTRRAVMRRYRAFEQTHMEAASA